MKRVMTSCDMGSIKIHNEDMSAFYMNSIGDMPNTVDIYEKGEPEPDLSKVGQFMGHFTVKGKPAYLSAYDCDDSRAHEFSAGRWFVSLKGDRHFFIIYQDGELHA